MLGYSIHRLTASWDGCIVNVIKLCILLAELKVLHALENSKGRTGTWVNGDCDSRRWCDWLTHVVYMWRCRWIRTDELLQERFILIWVVTASSPFLFLFDSLHCSGFNQMCRRFVHAWQEFISGFCFFPLGWICFGIGFCFACVVAFTFSPGPLEFKREVNLTRLPDWTRRCRNQFVWTRAWSRLSRGLKLFRFCFSHLSHPSELWV